MKPPDLNNSVGNTLSYYFCTTTKSNPGVEEYSSMWLEVLSIVFHTFSDLGCIYEKCLSLSTRAASHSLQWSTSSTLRLFCPRPLSLLCLSGAIPIFLPPLICCQASASHLTPPSAALPYPSRIVSSRSSSQQALHH